MAVPRSIRTLFVAISLTLPSFTQDGHYLRWSAAFEISYRF